MAFELPESTRRSLLGIANEAIGELLADESINHVLFDQIQEAHIKLLSAYGKMSRLVEGNR